ncbi:hypothetical protein P7K49_031447 [Saguinus oedipus]|uniref:Uncharacterized protein n=1 Tax=Saguinus oedipus TaxID=9490 RepID=A0ABQ9TZH9_SAGOE|nr:hypothetical protein P7K49_031447 [Saguinus oedipus]
MEDPQRPRSHTVTTTTSSFAENFSTSSSSFAYDREFLRTLPGLLIVAEISRCGSEHSWDGGEAWAFFSPLEGMEAGNSSDLPGNPSQSFKAEKGLAPCQQLEVVTV